MAQKIDLLKIAQEEQNGDLFKCLDGIYKRSKTQPRGFTDATIWEGGNFAGDVKPVAHAFTDMFALNGTSLTVAGALDYETAVPKPAHSPGHGVAITCRTACGGAASSTRSQRAATSASAARTRTSR